MGKEAQPSSAAAPGESNLADPLISPENENVAAVSANVVSLKAVPVPEMDDGNQTVEANARFVSVVAPSSLPEGSMFVAELQDGRSFEVHVGEGGVMEGSQMTVPYPTTFLAAAGTDSSRRGQWKYGLCGCFSLGICHPMFCNACFCHFVSIGQLMTRMRLDCLARPTTHEKAKQTFFALLALQFGLFIFTYLLHGTIAASIVVAVCLIYRVYVIAMTRRKVRARYGIGEEEGCGGAGDFCCGLWCSCCSIIQMARQTNEYETYKGLCCSPTGLPDTAPALEP